MGSACAVAKREVLTIKANTHVAVQKADLHKEARLGTDGICSFREIDSVRGEANKPRVGGHRAPFSCIVAIFHIFFSRTRKVLPFGTASTMAEARIRKKKLRKIEAQTIMKLLFVLEKSAYFLRWQLRYLCSVVNLSRRWIYRPHGFPLGGRLTTCLSWHHEQYCEGEQAPRNRPDAWLHFSSL